MFTILIENYWEWISWNLTYLWHANQKIQQTIDSFCIGSLIHPRYILTSAHCVACRTVNDTAVILGKNKLKFDMTLMEELVFLADILVYPDYVRGVNMDVRNNPDIALLKLEQAITIGPKLNIISLPTDPSSLYEEETMTSARLEVTKNLNTSHVTLIRG